jgi:integrase
MSPVRAPSSILVDDITGPVSRIEPALSVDSIHAAIAATTQAENELAKLARVLRHDATVLTGPAGTVCVVNIEPLIRNLQKVGGTSVVVPRCSQCSVNPTEMYSRQLRVRLCRACTLARYGSTMCECANCGRQDRPAYRARVDGILCRRCVPEPDVDHHAAVIDGLAALHTGLSAEVIEQIADTLKTTAAKRELNWILHDQPGVFTGTNPHESARSVRLAGMLIAAGAANICVPRCASCSRQTALPNNLHGYRCCGRCWRHERSRGPCARCGRHGHLQRIYGTEECVCTHCYRNDASNHRQCTRCGAFEFIEHRDGDIMVCRRCYRKPLTVCGICGGKHQCWRGHDGHPICSTCAAKQRTKEACRICHELRPVHVRSEAGDAICNRCARKREPCARCGKVLQVSARLPDLGPLCSACLKREPAFFSNCQQCGVHGRTHHRGLCPACACPVVLNDLFSRGGRLSPAARQVVDALLKCDAAAVLRWVQKTRNNGLAVAIRDLDRALTHERLDQLRSSKSREWLRNLLMDADTLPQRDVYLHRTEEAIKTSINAVGDRDDRNTLRSYATWHHLRKLRVQSARKGLKPGSGKGAQREIGSIADFLGHLHLKQSNLNSCRQHHVDAWSADNPTKASLHQFLTWAVRRGHAAGVTAHPKQTRRTRPTLPGDDQRWQLIQRLIEAADLETRDRVAGLLILLYSQPTARLIRIELADVATRDDGRITLRLGQIPLTLPTPLDQFIGELVAQRRGYAAVTASDNPWLFPGGRSGQHLSSEQMGQRMRNIGIPPQLARNTALIDLAGELPAAVIARLLGFNIKRAATWNIEAGNTNPRYAAALARGGIR